LTASVELVPLKCVRCGTFVQAAADEVAWVCHQCGQGLLLDEAGLAPLAVHWPAPQGPRLLERYAGTPEGAVSTPRSNSPGALAGPSGLRDGQQAGSLRWLPFWAFTGSVHFAVRQSYSGSRKPDKLWNAPRRFFIPAFPYPLEDMQQLGATLTRQQPALQPGPAAAPLSRCTLFPADARQAVEFIVLTIEADQKDKLRQVSFTLELSEPELWVLPFTEQGGLRLAVG